MARTPRLALPGKTLDLSTGGRRRVGLVTVEEHVAHCLSVWEWARELQRKGGMEGWTTPGDSGGYPPEACETRTEPRGPRLALALHDIGKKRFPTREYLEELGLARVPVPRLRAGLARDYAWALGLGDSPPMELEERTEADAALAYRALAAKAAVKRGSGSKGAGRGRGGLNTARGRKVASSPGDSSNAAKWPRPFGFHASVITEDDIRDAGQEMDPEELSLTCALVRAHHTFDVPTVVESAARHPGFAGLLYELVALDHLGSQLVNEAIIRVEDAGTASTSTEIRFGSLDLVPSGLMAQEVYAEPGLYIKEVHGDAVLRAGGGAIETRRFVVRYSVVEVA